MQEKTKGISRETIKYLAIVTMVINHFANAFLHDQSTTYYVMTCIGYFTAPVMCYFLVEGFHYTRSLKRYAIRMFGFAVLSQIPYQMALYKEKPLEFRNFNMLFTLLLCLGILYVMNYVEAETERVVLVFILLGMSLWCDWAVSAPMFVIFFQWFRGGRRKKLVGFAFAALEEGILYAMSMDAAIIGLSFWEKILWGLAGCAGTIAAGLIITFLYNGKKAARGGVFHRWFFYIFYPLHLLIFGLIRLKM